MNAECSRCGVTVGDLPYEELGLTLDDARQTLFDGNMCMGCAQVPDPTHGRIDPDIQAAVNEMRPSDIGQRVALENTLQDQRDRRRPASSEEASGDA